MFSIGEKVVCIYTFERRSDHSNGVVDPINGEMYTIRTINTVRGYVYLRFEEVRNPMMNYLEGYTEAQYISDKFRKLDHSFAEDVIAQIKEEVLTESH